MQIKITGIRKLQDGTVVGTFSTENVNYLPLVIMDNSGEEIHLDTERKEEVIPAFYLVMKDMIQREIDEAYQKGFRSIREPVTTGE